MVTTETYPALSLDLYVAIIAVARSCARLSDIALKVQCCVKAQYGTSAASLGLFLLAIDHQDRKRSSTGAGTQ